MTREEIMQLNSDYLNGCESEHKMNELFGYVLELQKHEQQPCEDAISRDGLLKAIDTWNKFGYTETGCFVREPKNNCIKYIHYDDVIKCIKGMPPVTPQPKIGQWIRKTIPGCLIYGCNQCGWQQTYATDFCPDCSARMVEPQESEE